RAAIRPSLTPTSASAMPFGVAAMPPLIRRSKLSDMAKHVGRSPRLGNRRRRDYVVAMIPAHLEDRSIVALSGPEARGFLQGLTTNDVEKLASGRAIYAALLTPQGKVLFDFILVEGDGALLIDCARESRDALIKRLSMYRLRAKIAIEPREQLSVYSGANGPRGMSFEDPRLAALGLRTIGATAEMPQTAQ